MDAVYRWAELMRPYLSGVALLVTWAGIALVALRRRWRWRSKRFMTQVNFSLNYVVGSRLAMRTLLETTADRVWANEHGVGLVLAAAGRTTKDAPIVVMKDTADQDFVNRAVLNALSERFAEAFVAAALGALVRRGTFVFALTNEKHAVMRTFKLRILLVEERTLLSLFGPEGGVDRLEPPSAIYEARRRTLRQLYETYVKDRSSAHPLLGRVELGVLTPTAEGGGPEGAVPFGWPGAGVA